MIGEDPASCVYVNSKAQKCVELGLRSEKFLLDTNATMDEVLALIDKLNKDKKNGSRFLQEQSLGGDKRS